MKNTSLYLGLFAVALTIQSCSEPAKEEKKPADKLPLVSLASASIESFKHKITVQGNVETDQDVLLSSEAGGLLTSISVKEGQRVSQGQVLATVDASIISSNIQELQTQLEHANYMFEKQKELKAKNLGTEFDYQNAESQVKAIQAKIKSLSTQRGKAVLTAPFSGTIDKIFAKNGQMTTPGNPILRLVNNSKIEITADVSEKHLAHVKVGTPIEVTFPNFTDTTVNLKITNVGNYIEPTNRTFRIMSEIPNNKVLLPNMLAEVHITDFNVDSALVIPSASIMKSQNNEDYIFVASKKGEAYEVKKVVVELIERYNGDAMIANTNAIQPGTMIVVEGNRGIVEGDKVRTK